MTSTWWKFPLDRSGLDASWRSEWQLADLRVNAAQLPRHVTHYVKPLETEPMNFNLDTLILWPDFG